MALAPDTAPWYRRFRMLIGIYLIAMVFGAREYLLSRADGTVDQGSDEWSEMVEVIASVNPEDADTDYLLAMEAKQMGDVEQYMLHMETALAKDVKHNNALLAEYAHQLIRMQAPFDDIDRALNRWRLNHQLSFEILELPLGAGPQDDADQTALRRELDNIDWIYNYQLRAPTEVIPTWVVLTQFEPAIEASVRDLVEALSILGVHPDDRARLSVRCTSFDECRAITR